MRYGFRDDDWTAAKREMVAKLTERAKVRGMIPYSELVREIKAIRLEPVVHKHGDMQPGPGFFELAGSLGRDTSDILKCWIDELKKVHGHWSR